MNSEREISACSGGRAQVDVLPADTTLADWGRWILSDRADRSIAPGFTLEPAKAGELASRFAAAAAEL